MFGSTGYFNAFVFTARCTTVQSAVLGSHIVCPSVRLSVTLMDCDNIDWNSSKIISRLVSLLFAGCIPQHHGSTPRGTLSNVGWNRGGVRSHWRLLIYCSSLHMTACGLSLFTSLCIVVYVLL